MSKSIDLFIDRKVVILKENDTILNAAKAMRENQVGCVLISDKAGICGILTDRDIVCNSVSLNLDSSTELRSIMETDIIYLEETDSVGEAIKLMKENGIRRLPILKKSRNNKVKKCIGIVTLDDLITEEIVLAKDLGHIIRSQILRQKKVFHQRAGNISKLDQTFNKFILQISKGIGLEKKKTQAVTEFILGAIVKRLHYKGGAHFISQLPKHCQEELLNLPARPDRSITDNLIVQGIAIRADKDLEQSKEIAKKIWEVICNLLGHGETAHVILQLPDSLKKLFLGDFKLDAMSRDTALL